MLCCRAKALAKGVIVSQTPVWKTRELANIAAALISDHCRKEPVRFDSFQFRTFRKKNRLGSDGLFPRFDVVRPASCGRVVARSGSVRFLSASSSGRFQSETVRFGLAGSVRFPIPSCHCFCSGFRSLVVVVVVVVVVVSDLN